MRVHLEFFGLSRLSTGTKEIVLDLGEGTTFRDIVRLLAAKYPKLLENVIKPDGETLQHPNRFNLNARRMIQPSQMGECPSDDDRIILMSVSAGG
jgi:molybdopterin converting factor small subunit